MADVQVIGAKVQVDTGNSTASIKELKDNIKLLNTELEKTKLGSPEQTAAYVKLKSAQDQLAATTGNLSKTTQETGGHFSKLKEQISAVPGPLGDASEGVNKLSGTFKALLANPVVLVLAAIVAALGFLYKAFTNTFEGGEKAEAALAGIKAAAAAVLDSILDLGGAIIKFFSGDFKGAFEDAKKAITGVVDAAKNAYGQMSTLTKQAQEIHKEQLANDLDQAKRAKDLAILREQATDESVPLAKRKAALLELQAAAKENAKVDIDLATRTRDNIIAINSIGKDAALKNRDVINKAQIQAVQVETDNANELRRIGKQITAANKQENAERTAAEKEAAAKQKEIRAQLEAFNTELNKIKELNGLAGITDQYKKEQQILENHLADEKAAINKQFADRKINRDQYNQLVLAQDENAANQRKALTDKHNKSIADSEVKFENELSDLQEKIKLDSITDQYQKEQLQIDINRGKALRKAQTDYANDAARLFQIEQAITADFDNQRDAAAEKKKKDDANKKLDSADKTFSSVSGDPKATFKDKQAALDADVKANQDAYDAKAITEDKYLDNKRKNAEAERKIEKEKLDTVLNTANLVGDALGNLSELVGKNTAAGKAFAAAQATISAITGAVQSFTSLSGIPIVGPALGAIAAAAALAAGYANVKKIYAVDIPGQASGGGSVPGGSVPAIPAAPISPTQSGTKLPQSQIDKIGQAQPIQAYVVQGQGQEAANRAARLADQARLGG